MNILKILTVEQIKSLSSKYQCPMSRVLLADILEEAARIGAQQAQKAIDILEEKLLCYVQSENARQMGDE